MEWIKQVSWQGIAGRFAAQAFGFAMVGLLFRDDLGEHGQEILLTFAAIMSGLALVILIACALFA